MLHIDTRYLTLEDVAQLAGVSRWTVLRDIQANRLDAHRFGPHATLVLRDDATAYAARRADKW